MSKAVYVGVDGVARKVPKIYVGVDGVARKVKKGYIGVDGVARLFYSSQTRPPRLPTGYTELEYIRTNNVQYIDTGLAAGYARTAKIKARIVEILEASSAATNKLLYSEYSQKESSYENLVKFDLNYNNDFNVFATCGFNRGTSGNLTQNTQLASNYNAPFEASLAGDGTVYFNEIKYQTGSLKHAYDVGWGMSSIKLGGIPNRGHGIVDLYSFQLHEGNNLLADLVPCKNTAGMVGMYDLVRELFFSDANNGSSFSAGPEV